MTRFIVHLDFTDQSQNTVSHEKEIYSFDSEVNGDEVDEVPKTYMKDEETTFEDEQNSANKISTIASVVPINLQQEFSSDINIPNVQILKVRLMVYTIKKFYIIDGNFIMNFP